MLSIAQKIREHVQKYYFEPARKGGLKKITIRAGDVRIEMGLKNLQRDICQTLRGTKLGEQCNVQLINERRGSNVHQSDAANIWYTYKIL